MSVEAEHRFSSARTGVSGAKPLNRCSTVGNALGYRWDGADLVQQLRRVALPVQGQSGDRRGAIFSPVLGFDA